MPFTPFHFGPGLLLKGILPGRFSWGTFALTQVVIDCETLYHIVAHRYPLHRELHTFVGATAAGLATAALALGAKRLSGARAAALKSELSAPAVWLGGLIGGASHPLLDGLMHPDIRPFMPFSAANPLLGTVDLQLLHWGCFAAAVVGAVFLMMRARTP